jgi:hypothetical protein
MELLLALVAGASVIGQGSVFCQLDPVDGGACFVVFPASDQPFGDQGAKHSSGNVIIAKRINFMQPSASWLIHTIGNCIKKSLLFFGKFDHVFVGLVSGAVNCCSLFKDTSEPESV